MLRKMISKGELQPFRIVGLTAHTGEQVEIFKKAGIDDNCKTQTNIFVNIFLVTKPLSKENIEFIFKKWNILG
jgi:hypothetical protein